ncbi:hypothetical protein ACJMK2_036598 [Sinanodonta woodiana]|uniref:Uncharacterized protein n=1 Tax=Sinanodonta woodiana TaxID=1069815 RepID=A0ABD3WL34_SINWO
MSITKPSNCVVSPVKSELDYLPSLKIIPIKVSVLLHLGLPPEDILKSLRMRLNAAKLLVMTLEILGARMRKEEATHILIRRQALHMVDRTRQTIGVSE